MKYRRLVLTGAACAAVGLLAGGAMAQIGQQQPRPGQVTPINGKEFLQQLEGEWNVEVTIYNLGAIQDHRTMRPGEPRPGQPGAEMQVRTHIEQSFVRLGVSQTEARQHAERLSQRIMRERLTGERLRATLEQTLIQAGADRMQAQQESQRLSTVVGRFVTPTQPGEPRPGLEREAELRAEGTATRNWELNENILVEELRFAVRENNNNPQERPRIGEVDVDLRGGDEYAGHGMFAFEGPTGDLCMVWADNVKSMLHYSIGQYDTAQQAMIFYTINPKEVTLPQVPMRPGVSPTPRPAPGGPQVDQQRPGQIQERPGVDRPGQAREGMRLNAEGSRMVLRIVDDNEHIVQVFYGSGFGRAAHVMDITYTRKESSD